VGRGHRQTGHGHDPNKQKLALLLLLLSNQVSVNILCPHVISFKFRKNSLQLHLTITPNSKDIIYVCYQL